jgi:hypothetical protein
MCIFFLKKNNRKMRFYKELGSYKIIGKVSFDEDGITVLYG